jgi:hypothetical protein
VAQGTHPFEPGSSPRSFSGVTELADISITGNRRSYLPYDVIYDSKQIHVLHGPVTQKEEHQTTPVRVRVFL